MLWNFPINVTSPITTKPYALDIEEKLFWHFKRNHKDVSRSSLNQQNWNLICETRGIWTKPPASEREYITRGIWHLLKPSSHTPLRRTPHLARPLCTLHVWRWFLVECASIVCVLWRDGVNEMRKYTNNIAALFCSTTFGVRTADFYV